MNLAKYAKAVIGALVAAGAVWQSASGINTPAGNGITSGEWVNIVVAGVIGGAAVWAVPNTIGSFAETPSTTGRHRIDVEAG
jgi:hypothetical protein